MRLVSIIPTIFYIDTIDGLRQLARLELDNPETEMDAVLWVQIGEIHERIALSRIAHDKSEHEIYLPDCAQPEAITFQLWTGDEFHDEVRVDWQPGKKWEVHLVHYSHHDLGYTDLPSNVIQEHIGFLDDVLQYCEETEGWPEEIKFRWLVEQGYSLVEFIENRPEEAVDRLMRFARCGQIEVTALFTNQTLELCSHEELVRLLYPTILLKRKYGIEIVSATHNDIPGFSWGLASVLAAAGVKYFCLGMPSWYYGQGDDRVHPLWDEVAVLPLEMPGAFWWQGPDGNRILLWYNLHGMEWSPTNYQHSLKDLPEMLARLDESGYPYDQVMYTIRGGERDNAPPSLKTADLAKEWRSRWAYPKVVTSTHSLFLEKFQRRYGDTLKTLRGDVPGTDYPVGAACTPKETAVNRRTHDWLMTGEKLATMASMVSPSDYPKKLIDRAYRNVIYYDEHCWGTWQSAGPGLDGDWSEKGAFAYRGAALAYDLMLKASNQIADHIIYPEDGYYITVFNPLSWVRSDIVRVPGNTLAANLSPMHWEPARRKGEGPVLVAGSVIGRKLVDLPESILNQPFELVDLSTGRRLPYQISRLADFQAARPWAAERFALGQVYPGYMRELVFLAIDLPAMGYKTYRVVPCEEWPEFPDEALISQEGIENRYYRLQVEAHTGQFSSLLDKELGCEIIDSSAAHGFGQMVVRSSESEGESTVEITDFSINENGPVYTTFRRKGQALGCPEWSQEIVLYHGIKRIEVNTRLLRDAQGMLTVFFAFPFKIDNPRFNFEAPNAVIEPIRDQLPGTNTDYYAIQHWADVSGEDWGACWASLDAHLAEFGGLWAGYVSGAHHGVTPPGYGHAFLKPGELSKGAIYSLAMENNFRTNFINVHPGDVLFRYAFTTHAGDWQKAKVWQFGWNVMNSPQPVCMKGPQSGYLVPMSSLCQVDAPNVILVTLKRAEDGDGVILRLVEVIGRETQTTITLPDFPILHAYLTDPVEEIQRRITSDQHSVQLAVGPYSVTTIRLIPQR